MLDSQIIGRRKSRPYVYNIDMERRAKIVATIGPACQEESVLEKLFLAGMNVARLNFSHGTQEEHTARLLSLKAISRRHGLPLAILQDLQGPRIRLGKITGTLVLHAGEQIKLYSESSTKPTGISIPVDFPELFGAVHSDDNILLDDGRLVLTIQSVETNQASAEVMVGGEVSSHKGINLPGIHLDIPAFTKKDKNDVIFGLQSEVDIIAISFVQNASDVHDMRNIIRGIGKGNPLLIAKLERPQALAALEDILEAADGVMVARGDLGIEMVPEDVPGAQKQIIQAANMKGKIVITATQMLESMTHNPLPTRAEASDVANAIYDGTDAVMLSGETAAGDYPVESIVMMDRIIRQAELNYDRWGHGKVIELDEHDDVVAISRAARELAKDRDVEAIAVFTRTGRTAILMSKTHPGVPLLAFTPIDETYRQMTLAWGVTPYRVPWANSIEEMIAHVETAIREKGLVRSGGQVVVVSGYPVSGSKQSNLALLHTLN
jgi:pyruvate kinase